MNREEEIKAANPYGNSSSFASGKMIGFTIGAEWADAHPKNPWISVKEQLPEEGQKVFVLVMCYGTPYIREEKFCRNSNLVSCWHGFPPPLSMRYSKPTRMYWNGLRRKETDMGKYRIYRYGLFDHIFDVQVKKWYGWVLVKRFKADVSSNDAMIDNIYYCEMLSKELLEKLEEEL